MKSRNGYEIVFWAFVIFSLICYASTLITIVNYFAR